MDKFREEYAMDLRSLMGGLAITLVAFAGTPAVAQQDLPLSPVPPRGLHVSPWFEGWYQNPDGTYTLSFGYYNRNSQEAIDIEYGADNFIEPAEFDGPQPTHFAPGRERGVFAVTVPADVARGDVVWTLRNRGGTYSVPGRITSTAYDLAILGRDGEGDLVFPPMAEGSVPPALRFERDGAAGRGPGGIRRNGTLSASVGRPLQLAVWVDDSASKRDPVPLNVTWFKHSGPGDVTFDPSPIRQIPIGQPEVTTTATFSAPGTYVVRARADNHAQRDSAPGEQCCWTNGYIEVQVSP